LEISSSLDTEAVFSGEEKLEISSSLDTKGCIFRRGEIIDIFISRYKRLYFDEKRNWRYLHLSIQEAVFSGEENLEISSI
jgi:hypothetical protein